MKSPLHLQAKELAAAMHRIAAWSNHYADKRRNSPCLIKLPPIFLGGVSGNPKEGQKNLEAMVKTLADYQSDGLTLNELPTRYASYGGHVKGDEIGIRRIHNWMHQVAFGIRAAMVDMCDAQNTQSAVVTSVLDGLDNAPLVFVARSGNEYRPLRYASKATKERWIRDEVKQRRAGVNYNNYGAQITDDEWCQNGVGMQYRVAHSSLKDSIDKLVAQAHILDNCGKYDEAETIDEALCRMERGAHTLDGIQSEIEETN